jgi:hypothetical protein
MRTTIRINPSLLSQAKRRTQDHGKTLQSLIKEARREKLSRRPATTTPRTMPLPTFSGAIQPGVDLNNIAALLDLLDGR